MVLSLATVRSSITHSASRQASCRSATNAVPSCSALIAKRRVMLGDIMRLQPRIGSLHRPDPGEPQILRQPALQRAEHPLGAPARLRRIGRDMLDPEMR